jgi:probable rRNA maturation factor
VTIRVDVRLDPLAPAGLTSERLAALARFALEREGVSGPVAVGLAIVDDATIQALHGRHLAIDEPTDVLTFALADDDAFVSGEMTPLLGDVIVSHETAAAQATDYGHSPSREVAFLVLHGLLHLLGWSDDRDADRAMLPAGQHPRRVREQAII